MDTQTSHLCVTGEDLIPKPWTIICFHSVCRILETGCRDVLSFSHRALVRAAKFIHTKFGKLFLYGPHYVHKGIFLLKLERGAHYCVIIEFYRRFPLTETKRPRLKTALDEKYTTMCCPHTFDHVV